MSKGETVNYYLLFRPLIAPVLIGMFGLIAITLVIEVAKRESQKLVARFQNKNSAAAKLHELTPTEFVIFCAEFFRAQGYGVVVTEGLKDMGADLIIDKDGEKTVIQVKRNTKFSGVQGVRQVVCAKAHYNADQTMVFSSSVFTKTAISLARSNRVQLFDSARIEQTLNTFPPDFIAQTQNAKHLYPSLGRRIQREHGKDAVRKSLG